MMKRRPHWDDDLLAAVLRYLHDPAPLTDDDRAWNIVEAVEDWHEAKGEENLPLEIALLNAEATKHVRLRKQAEAAIQRVREASDGSQAITASALSAVPCPYCVDAAFTAGYVDAMLHVRRALDGGDA